MPREIEIQTLLENEAIGITTFLSPTFSMRGYSHCGIQVSWDDAVAASTITLETSNYPRADELFNAVENAEVWAQEAGITFTGPTGVAADTDIQHLDNFGAAWGRLRIVGTAAGVYNCYIHRST